ncbi:MAG: PAS domain-containing sensor histidine kinase [Caldilineaceae bacterium]|nr:PAS domain-containing sensor histidine kinase [Caldilineaceae bacterium]
MTPQQNISSELAKVQQYLQKAQHHVANVEAHLLMNPAMSGDSEERYQRLFDNMLEGCQLIGYDWRYLYVNQTAAHHGQCKREDLLGFTMMERYPGIDQTPLFALLQRCLQERTAENLENQFVYPDGTLGWFELRIRPVPEGIFILSLDITARKRIEQAEQALMRLKEEFVANVSHELCTPLFAISGAVKLLQKLIGKDPPVTQELMGILENNAVRLKVLVDDLLDLSRLDTGQLPLDLQEVDMRTLIVETFQLLKLQADAKRIDLQHQLPTVALLLRVDPHRMQQILINLIGNAIKFSSDQSLVLVTAQIEQEMVYVEVIDQGPGIPPEMIPKLFNKFYQIDGFDPRAYGGTGLGLYIAKQMVEIHRGRIGVKSDLGKGSTFYFAIPIASVLSPAQPERS